MPHSSAIPGDPFALPIAPQTSLARAALAAARPFLWRLLGLERCHEIYSSVTKTPILGNGRSAASFEARVLEALDLRMRICSPDGLRIPSTGALIVAANHPTGAVDGLVLLEAIRKIRPDVRLLANYLLASLPELSRACFFVDPFGTRAATARSQPGLRAAHLWLRSGGALIVFPAGEVASRRIAGSRTAVDSAWHLTLGRLALATGAAVTPVFLDGCNSRLFYAAGTIHPLLRTALLGREMLKRRGKTTRVVLGQPIGASELRAAGSASGATALVRRAVDALSNAGDSRAEQIVGPTDAARVAADIDALPPAALLLTSGPYDVFCAGATRIPNVLPEIGRLREVAFRAVGEGTGRSIDLDRFDAHYEHLFVWNRERREVAGAYRVGATDRIVRSHGLSGLYTRSLFQYDERLLARISPAFELGRSFVRPEYQRGSNVLLLLWKGIGTLLGRAPSYRHLFGCVSISNRYQDMSQLLLRAFLAEHHLESTLADLVEPLNPPPPVPRSMRRSPGITRVGELDELLRTLERGAGIPVLLRQYLRLNATLLGFNVDPAFGDALDALMMVHLDRLPAAILRRYIGYAQAA